MAEPAVTRTLRTGTSRRGFTTIELMVVMVIFVLMSTAVVMSMSPALSDARLRSGSRMIISVLNYARSYAVAHQTAARVSFDRAGNGIVVEAMMSDEKGEQTLTPLTSSVGKYRKLPSGLEIAPIEKSGTDEEEDFISFTQIGQSETAAVTIADSKGRQRRITVDAITGRCSIDATSKVEARSSK